MRPVRHAVPATCDCTAFNGLNPGQIVTAPVRSPKGCWQHLFVMYGCFAAIEDQS